MLSLSYGMKELIPLLNLLKEVSEAVGIPEEQRELHTTIFEDNSAALILAQMELPRMTPRSKHFAVRYHWFRSKIAEYKIDLVPCKTGDQLADIMTKGLRAPQFIELRKRLCGW